MQALPVSRIGIIVATVLWMTFMAAPCHAGGKEEAKERFEKGVSLYKNGDYTAALVEFKAAYAAKPHFAVKYNIGITLNKLHRYSEALVELQAFLDEGGDDVDPDRKEEVQQLLDDLAKLVSTVTFTCNAPGAKLFLNGKYTTDLEATQDVVLDVGEYDIEIRAKGYETFYDKIDVAGAQQLAVEAELTSLEPDEPEEEPEEKVVVVVENVVKPPPEEPEPQPEPPKPEKKLPSKAPFWVFFSLTMTSTVLAIIPTVSFWMQRSEYMSTDYGNESDMDRKLRDLRDVSLAADVIWGVTGALAIVTVITGAVIFKKRKKLKEQAVSLVPGPGALSLSGVF